MAELTQITDYQAEILPQIMEKYKESTNFKGILDLVSTEMNMLDAAQMELQFLLDIDAAEGAQLDILGEIANEARNSRADSVYRDAIRRKLSYRNSGTPEDIIRLVKAITSSTVVDYRPEYPAGYWLTYDGVGLTQAQLDELSPAGVQGFAGCPLAFANGEYIRDATGDYFQVVGPCDP